MSRLVIFGLGEAAQVADFYFGRDGVHEVVGFTATSEFVQGSEVFGRPLVPFEGVQDAFPPGDHALFVAIGFSKMNRVRRRFFEEAKAKGYRLPSYISPRASYYGTPVGENCFILEDNTIQPFSRIGDNVVLWSGNHIGHHARIGSHCFITSHVVISGGVIVGDSCFIGVNATVRDHVTIGEDSLIGAGALIMKDTEPRSVYTTPRTKRYADDSLAVGL